MKQVMSYFHELLLTITLHLRECQSQDMNTVHSAVIKLNYTTTECQQHFTS